jgi:hypothetical protein
VRGGDTRSEIGDLIDWVEKDFHPSVQGQGPRKGAKGEAKVAARCDRLGYFVAFVFSSGGPLSQDGSP